MNQRNLLRLLGTVGAGVSAAAALAAPIRFATPGDDQGRSVAVHNATGDFIVAGTAYNGPVAHNEMFVARYSPGGALLWAQVFGLNGDDAANAVAINQVTGEIYVAGHISPAVGVQTDAMVLRLSPGGVLLGSVIYAGGAGLDDSFKHLVVTPAGQVFAAGLTDNGGASGDDLLAARYTAGLGIVWQNMWISPFGDETVKSVAFSPAGLYLAGSRTSPMGDLDGITVRFFPGTGAFLGVRLNTGAAGADAETNAVATDVAGDVYTCSSETTAAGDVQIRTTRSNASFTSLRWSNVFNAVGGINRDQAADMVVGGPGVVIGASSTMVSGPDADYVVYCLNPATGAFRPGWFATYDNGGADIVTDITLDIAGNTLVAGISGNGANRDFAVGKLDMVGATMWMTRYDNGGHDDPMSLAIGAGMMPIVTGRSEAAGLGFDVLSLRLNPASGAIL